MYFENILFNLILMIGIIIVFTIINFYLNHYARFFMKYTSKQEMNSQEIINQFSKLENIMLDSYPSKASNDLDNYIHRNKSIFINSRHYYSTSLYTLARTLYFCAMSKLAKKNIKKYKFQNTVDSIFTLLDILGWGVVFIGLLLKINILIIFGILIIFISFVFTLINIHIIKKYYQIALDYLSINLKEPKEKSIIKIIYRFEYIQYIFKPFLAIVHLFPFLLSVNQKKMGDIYGK